jgi:hypothetical protein
MIDHNNLEEFADPHNYDMEDDSDTGIAFARAIRSKARSRASRYPTPSRRSLRHCL